MHDFTCGHGAEAINPEPNNHPYDATGIVKFTIGPHPEYLPFLSK
jgi:hypothetical protein